MSINNIGSYRSSFYSPEKALQNLQEHKLEASKDINLQEMAAAKSGSLADLGIKPDIDLSKFSDLSDKSPINLDLVNYWGNSIDTNGLENLLNSMSLDQEQISFAVNPDYVKVLNCNLVDSHVSRQPFALEDPCRACIGAHGTYSPVVHGTVGFLTALLAISLDGALEAFAL
jgi:hypothetical protein